ncbi:MAG: LysM peptidoglycan-binding domain-containing protein [Opitutales bacterium]|nr:LysM peptidoglycan-binding domain-containing protein [Opitutales bacterium]
MLFYGNSIIEKRKSIAALIVAIVVVLYMLSVGGCDFVSEDNIVKEENEPHFVRGREELSRGNPQEAMIAFLKVVEKRKDAPESHLELGRLYLNEMKDYVFAIYHFRKFLELCPNSPMSMQVRQLIDTARKGYAASLPESPFENNLPKIELEEMYNKLQKENLELKQKLANAIERLDSLALVTSKQSKVSVVEKRQTTNNIPKASNTTKPTTNQVVVARDIPSSYVVQPGDTLSSISKRFYGSSRRWKDIFRSNRDRLVSPESVRPGQTLRLPR